MSGGREIPYEAWLMALLSLYFLGGDVIRPFAFAMLIGVVVGSLGLIVFGSPNPEPGPRELLRGLHAVGIEPSAIHRAAGGES